MIELMEDLDRIYKDFEKDKRSYVKATDELSEKYVGKWIYIDHGNHYYLNKIHHIQMGLASNNSNTLCLVVNNFATGCSHYLQKYKDGQFPILVFDTLDELNLYRMLQGGDIS